MIGTCANVKVCKDSWIPSIDSFEPQLRHGVVLDINWVT